MSEQHEIFDHDSPAVPTLTAGALLGASGITHAPHHTIGTLSGNSSANGSFSGEEGYGHIDYYNDYLYVFDSGNNRIQRFALNASGVFVYDSKLDSVSTLVGGGSTTYGVLAIDRSRGQIHITLGDYTQTSGAWISVWNLSDWGAGLTALNRVRQYGSNSASSDASGRSFLGLSLAIDDTYAIVSSALSPFRCLRWNHVTGALSNEATKSATVSQFATDGAGRWWCGSHSSDLLGIREVTPSTFASLTRLDTATANQLRLGQLSSASAGQRVFYYGGRVYGRDSVGLVTAWATAGGVVDCFLSPGALGPSNALSGGHSPSHNIAAVIYRDKGTAVTIGDKSYYVGWAHNANSTAVQAFLAVYPLTTSTATWTKTDWSSGTNTLLSIFPHGLHLSGEKWKIRLRKNAGSWITFTTEDCRNAAFFASVGTFTSGDTLTVELSLSTWDRLDLAASLVATRDKLSPSNVVVQLTYEDTAADVYVPDPVANFQTTLGDVPSFQIALN